MTRFIAADQSPCDRLAEITEKKRAASMVELILGGAQFLQMDDSCSSFHRRGIKSETEKSTSRTRLMKTHSCFRLLRNALAGAILFTTAALQAEAADQVKVTDLMTKDLVNFPGKEVTMITVDYPPGGADPVHRHNASASVYVLEGSIVMGVKGEKPVTLHPGQTWYEGPNDIHTIGRNASKTKPAKFLVFLVKDKGAPLFIPVND